MIVFLGALTIALVFVLGIAADRYGPKEGQIPKVADRFLERGDEHDDKFLRNWIGQYPDAARGYAFPTLFPLDLLFAIALGAFLCIGSVKVAESIGWLNWARWAFAFLPAVYIALDLIEDGLLARLLLNKDLVTPEAVELARKITKMKIVACGLAIAQTVGVSAIAMFTS
jgi:hypothetical protein